MMDILHHLKDMSSLETIIFFCVVGTIGSILWWVAQWLFVVIATFFVNKKEKSCNKNHEA